MSDRASPPRPLTAVRAKSLSGRLRVPGDAVISHLALLIGASALGETTIEGLGDNDDVAATREAVRAFGALIERDGDFWRVIGLGAGGLLTPLRPLQFGRAQGGLGPCLGLVGPYGFTTHFAGMASAASPANERVLAALRAAGVEILTQRDGSLPLTLRGPRTPVPIDYRLPPGAPDIKAMLLLAGIAVPGTTTISEAGPSNDVAETLLREFGAAIVVETEADGGRRIEMEGLPVLRGRSVTVPGDADAAAPLLVAGLIVPGSDTTIENVRLDGDSGRLIDLLQQMGGAIETIDNRSCGNWTVADLRVRHSPLRGLALPPEAMLGGSAGRTALAIAAAFATGDTNLPIGAAMSQRDGKWQASIMEGLRANGVTCTAGKAALTISGGTRKIGGGAVATEGDAMLAMGFLVLGLAASLAVTIDDTAAIAAHYPQFIAGIEGLGARFFQRVPQ